MINRTSERLLIRGMGKSGHDRASFTPLLAFGRTNSQKWGTNYKTNSLENDLFSGAIPAPELQPLIDANGRPIGCENGFWFMAGGVSGTDRGCYGRF